MKCIIAIRFGDNKHFVITNYKESWKEGGIKPCLRVQTNGSVKGNPEHTCLDTSLVIGYTRVY